MEINLSWDLFVIVFFAVIIAYSFIIGRNKTLKIIIASYIAILASDGVGNLIKRYFLSENTAIPALKSIGISNIANGESSLIIIKIFIFVFTIVLITTRGRFSIDMNRGSSATMNMILTLTYGVLSAGLITSTILIYASGASLVQESINLLNETVLVMYRESYMVQLMINNYNVWFSLPAITFILSSLVATEDVDI